jgi:hypothetical protein
MVLPAGFGHVGIQTATVAADLPMGEPGSAASAQSCGIKATTTSTAIPAIPAQGSLGR